LSQYASPYARESRHCELCFSGVAVPRLLVLQLNSNSCLKFQKARTAEDESDRQLNFLPHCSVPRKVFLISLDSSFFRERMPKIEDLTTFSVAKLKAFLKERNIPGNGTKSELLQLARLYYSVWGSRISSSEGRTSSLTAQISSGV
jgi:hypothetical protein